jgi:hypothetical protein
MIACSSIILLCHRRRKTAEIKERNSYFSFDIPDKNKEQELQNSCSFLGR